MTAYLNQSNLGHGGHVQTLVEQRHGVHNLQALPGLFLLGQEHSVDGQMRILGGVQNHVGVGARRKLDVGHGVIVAFAWSVLC